MGRNKTKGGITGGGSKPSPATVSRDLKTLDDYLYKHQLQRKPIAKDGSCLFRAIAEQVFVTQFYHHKVRMQCVNYIRAHQKEFQEFVTEPLDSYLERLTREMWGGEMELVVLSKLYTRTIIVYMYNEQSGGITPKTFSYIKNDNPIRLAYSDSNHYDSVYSVEYMQHMALCQGVLYTMLFEGVMDDTIPNICKKRLDSISEHELVSLGKQRDIRALRDKSLYNLASHYSTEELRAMGTHLYHNAALQAHNKERACIEKFDRQVATSIQFQVGDKCKFKLPDSKTQEGEISALYSSEDCHTVFVYDHNEEWVIPSKNISLKHPYATGRCNPSHQTQPNRSKNRQRGLSSNEVYPHQESSSHKPPPPSSNQEAWPPPTSQAHPNKPTTIVNTKTQKTAKPVASSQPLSRQFSDKKGAHDGDKPWPQKTSTTSTTPRLQPIPSTTKTTMQNPKVPIPSSKNTLESSSKALPLPPSSARKPPGLSKSGDTQQPNNTRPVKVNGGPGGSLTSEDSNYSGNSSSDEERGEQTSRIPSQANPAMRDSNKPLGQFNGQPEPNYIPQGWQTQSSHASKDNTIRVSPAANQPGPNAGNNFPESENFQQRGRESPYLVPQIPRDPSSQPEDDWPGFDNSQKEVPPPDPASSTLLAAMRSPPQHPNISPFTIPGDPKLVAVTTAAFNQMPQAHPHTAIFGPQFPILPPSGNHEISASAGVPLFPRNIPIPATSFQKHQQMFPVNAQITQSYIVHRTPSNSALNRAQQQPRGEPQQPMPAPNVPTLHQSFTDSKEHSPEPLKVVHPMIPVMPVNPNAIRWEKSTQTVPPLKKVESFTQVEKDEIESLTMTTYTQTPTKAYRSKAVNATVQTASTGCQAIVPVMNSDTQTSNPVALLHELSPPGMDEEATPVDKIKFAVQYAIQCLEVYTSHDESTQDHIDLFENLRAFEELELTGCLERMVPSLKPLDSSQQVFLQSFAGSKEFYASQLQQLSQGPGLEKEVFQQLNSDEHPVDQREMMGSLFRQQEMLRQQGIVNSPSREQGPSPHPPESSTNGKERDIQHTVPHPQGFPQPFPVPQYPLMMQRPLMMMPYFPFPMQHMPPFPMVPPQMVPHNIMEQPHSPHASSDTPHLRQDQESGEQDKTNGEIVVEMQESKDGSLPHLVAPSAFTVPFSVQSSTVVAPSQNNAQLSTVNNYNSASTNPSSVMVTESIKLPKSLPLTPPTPFETKNPYDNVTINSSPVADTHFESVVVDGTEGQSFGQQVVPDLPCRKGRQVNQKSQQQRSNSQRPKPRLKSFQAQSSGKQASKDPQIEGPELMKSGRAEERSFKGQLSSREHVENGDSSKVNPRSNSSRFSRHQKGRNRPQKQQQPGGSANVGASNQSTQSQGSRSYKSGKRQDTSTQVSNNSGRGGGDSTRSASFANHPDRNNLAIPYIAFQPHAFRGGFSPNQPAGTEHEGEYTLPLPAVNNRWKFTELSPSDAMNWHRKDPWPEWDSQFINEHCSETVEDPFTTFPVSQDQWQSDIGDLNISLTEESPNMATTRMYGIVPVSEAGIMSSKKSGSECVAQSLKLPK